jgi:hypothetical protein
MTEQMNPRLQAWHRLMTELTPNDHGRLNQMAQLEGWALFSAHGRLEVQAIDEPDKALTGSAMHIVALLLDGQSSLEPAWVPKVLVDAMRDAYPTGDGT